LGAAGAGLAGLARGAAAGGVGAAATRGLAAGDPAVGRFFAAGANGE
jgi:hypothetical protein